MCNFPTIKDAADVTIASMLSGIQVSRVELLDEVQVRAVNIANGKNLPKFPTLTFEFIGTGHELKLEILRSVLVLLSFGPVGYLVQLGKIVKFKVEDTGWGEVYTYSDEEVEGTSWADSHIDSSFVDQVELRSTALGI
ncbi:hypothetical protein ACOSQ3_028963 [Xanthoceras sorbifolium]